MKNIKPILLLLLFCIPALLNAQTWLWARNGGSGISASSRLLTVSPNGNIYNFGGFSGTFTLDSVNMNSTISSGYMLCANTDGVFLHGTKITPDPGTTPGTEGILFAASVSSDKQGSIYLTGGISNHVDFDTIETHSDYEGFIAKFDTNLNGLSVKKGPNDVYSVAFDSDKNVYIAGTVSSSVAYVDTFSLYNNSTIPALNPKMFLAKLDSTGKCLWVKQGWGGNSRISKIKIKNDNVYLLGYIDSCVTFDTVNQCLSSAFVMKTDRDGNVKWFSTYTRLNHAWFSSIDVDHNSNCYVIGGFDSTMIWEGQTLVKVPNSLDNGFVAKYDSTGSIKWVKQFSSDALFHFDDMHTNGSGYTYATGYFSQTGVFDSDTLTAQSAKDMFVLRVSPTGDYLGIKVVVNALANAITEDANGNAIVTGNLPPGTTNFDDIVLTTTGSGNFFLAKLSAITGPNSASRIMEDNRLVIYPNPNSNAFTIVVPEALAHGNSAHLSIFNNSGMVIKEEDTDITGNRVSTDISTVQKGIYTVILSSGHKKFTGRVVVE